MTSSTDGFGRRRSSFWATVVARDWTQNAASFVGQRFRPRAFWQVSAYSDWDWCDAKFELGKRDAAAHHDDIARVLKPL